MQATVASLSSASAIYNTTRSSSLIRFPVTAVANKTSHWSKRQNDVNLVNSFHGDFLIDSEFRSLRTRFSSYLIIPFSLELPVGRLL